MRNVDREILPKRSAGITTLIVIMFASALVLCESRSGVCAFMLRLEQPKSHRAEILGTNFPPTKQNTVPVKDANEQLRNTFDEPWIHENSGQGSGYQVKEGYSRYVVSKRRRQNVLKRRDRILKDIRDSISKRQALRRKKDSEDGDFEAVMDEKRSFIPNIFSFFRWRTSTKPGTLVLIRCGESVWNANKTFSGW